MLVTDVSSSMAILARSVACRPRWCGPATSASAEAYLDAIKDSVVLAIGNKVAHLESAPVAVFEKGTVAWDGKVELFSCQYPRLGEALFAWIAAPASAPAKLFVVFSGPGIRTAEDAVKTALAGQYGRGTPLR